MDRQFIPIGIDIDMGVRHARSRKGLNVARKEGAALDSRRSPGASEVKGAPRAILLSQSFWR